MPKKENPSNYSNYFMAGTKAFSEGLPVTAVPHEISQPESYSRYLRNAWVLGWETQKALAKCPEVAK